MIKPVNLEIGEFTKQDEERMWNTFREVWKKEREIKKDE